MDLIDDPESILAPGSTEARNGVVGVEKGGEKTG
jgi:hypothetical protein